MMRYALSPMVAYQYLATPENDWESLFHHYIPHWRVVQDETAARSFFEGLFAGESVPWGAWITPTSWTWPCSTVAGRLFCDDLSLRPPPQA